MAKPSNSVIGIDLGKHVFKSVLLQRKSDHRFVLTNYASRTVPETIATADDLAQEVKLLLKDMGGSAKSCAVAAPIPTRFCASSNSPTPRSNCFVVRFVSMASLFSTRSAKISCWIARRFRRVALAGVTPNGTATESSRKTRYLVGGMLRPAVKQISEALSKTKMPANIIQLAPICSFNAFEFAYPEVFANEAFLLLDMGHQQSTVLIGHKTELMLVRSIDYGGKLFGEALTADGAVDAEAGARPGPRRATRAWRKRAGARSSVSPPKCATRSDSLKANAKKAFTGFSSPAAWPGRK